MSAPETPATPANTEWRLGDLLDALAAEVDRAQDTVALKSFSRGSTVTLKNLDLSLAVGVRVDPSGRIFFHTVEPGQPAGTTLTLGLEEILSGQVEEVRQPLDGGGLPLSTLAGITPEEIAALGQLSILTLDDLAPYAATPARVGALARRTGIAEARLRGWLGLPYLLRIEPASGASGQNAVLTGGNLGAQGAEDAVYFQAVAAQILAWSASRITVRIPPGAQTGAVFALHDNAPTNTVAWALVEAPPPPPPPPPPPSPSGVTITGVVPDRAPAGTTQLVTINGSGFLPGLGVGFGDAIQVVVQSVAPTRVVVVLTLAPQALGPRSVRVANPDGQKGLLQAGFQVLAPPP